jgi:Domain of unknown function (DUF1905)/Bacteriocin-protection, YdeI or OmpD-Associated
MVEFTGTVELNGKTATGIEVPTKVVEGLGTTKRPAVRVTLGGHTYRSTVASMGGRFMLPVSADVRDAAGVAAGDRVRVRLELDTAPREVEVPRELTDAMAREPEVRKRWEALSYSNKRRHTLAIDGAKTPETRARRVAKALAELRGS